MNEFLKRAEHGQEAMSGDDANQLGVRQPVHTVYGGAHLFRAATTSKLGEIALRTFERHAPTPQELALALDSAVVGAGVGGVGAIHQRVACKLKEEPVEDYRIDFEDGYGFRPDDEEDEHAAQCAREIARGMAETSLPPFIGFRVKSFGAETRWRSLRTLDLLLTTLAGETGGRLPNNFVIALPKVSDPEAVASFVEAVSLLEERCGFPAGSIGVEIMVETPRAIVDRDGYCALPKLVEAALGRCVAAHFGAYDYTAACDITAAAQRLDHPACDFARSMMQAALAGTGVHLVDGATNLLPIEPHRAPAGVELSRQQRAENRRIVHEAWKLSSRNIRRALDAGFYQGWDLHPAQLPIRYAATYAFFLEGLDEATERLKQFIDRAAQATRLGAVFDDAATGGGLLNFFLRAINCGAITEEKLKDVGLSAQDLRGRSFMSIVRRGRSSEVSQSG